MRKYLVFIFLLIMFIPVNYNATSGALASDTIKTCPNGKLYGKHTNHWHRAVKRGNRYYATGSALKGDPCPPKSDNNELESLTIDGNEVWVYYDMKYETYNKNIKIKAVPSHPKAKVSTDYKSLKIGENDINITVTAENGEKQVYRLTVTLLEANISLKSLKINEATIEISDNMFYETYNKDITILAVPNGNNIKVSNNYKSLVDGENKITIILTDSYGNTKEYYINIVLKENDLSLKSLIIDNEEIEISNNMTYETYNKNIFINAIPSDENINVSNNLKELVLGDNEVLITLSDKLGNIKEYKIIVTLKERIISLDYLTINNEAVEISDEMTYETYSDDIIINASTNDEGITINNNYSGLTVGNNIITITLSDDYGNKREYKLYVIKLESVNKTDNNEFVPKIEEDAKNDDSVSNDEKNNTVSKEENNNNTSEIIGDLVGITAIGSASYAIIKKRKNK